MNSNKKYHNFSNKKKKKKNAHSCKPKVYYLQYNFNEAQVLMLYLHEQLCQGKITA